MVRLVHHCLTCTCILSYHSRQNRSIWRLMLKQQCKLSFEGWFYRGWTTADRLVSTSITTCLASTWEHFAWYSVRPRRPANKPGPSGWGHVTWATDGTMAPARWISRLEHRYAIAIPFSLNFCKHESSRFWIAMKVKVEYIKAALSVL